MRMKIEEKRERSRKQIMAASLELFYEKGYQRTTTRDIIAKAGILNGSLYNRFKSKEEILLSIVTEALERTLDKCEDILREEKNPLIAAVLPSALEISVSSKDRKAADLIYEVHRQWSAVDRYNEMNIEWFSKYLDKFGIDFAETEDLELKMLTFLGAIGNVCGHYANGGQGDCNKILRYITSYVSTLLGIPVMNMDRTIQRLTEIIDENEMKLLVDEDCTDIIPKERF